MKLYDPQKINHFVFAVVDAKAREGTAVSFMAVVGGDIEGCENIIDRNQKRNAYPHCMGRYDELGRYCVYKPGIEGISPGKFIVHPLAAEEKKVYDRELSYT